MIYNGEECYGVIYTITHIASGKKYVGQTTDLTSRWAKYVGLHCKNQPKILNALRKYGAQAFTFKTVYVAYDKTQLDWLECWFIDEGDTISTGYNCRSGGANGKLSAEMCKKRGAITRKRYEDPAARRNTGAALRKHHEEHPETRERMSAAIRKRYEDCPDTLEKMRAAVRRYCKSSEARAKKSAVMRKRYEDPKIREERSAAMRKHYEEHPETRERMSAALRKHYEDHPEAREKKSDTNCKHHEAHPERRERQRIALRKYYKDNPEARAKAGASSKESWRKRKLVAALQTKVGGQDGTAPRGPNGGKCVPSTCGMHDSLEMHAREAGSL